MGASGQAKSRKRIRVESCKIHPQYLYAIRTVTESTGGWEDFRLVSAIPAEQARRPLADCGCALANSR